MNKVCLLFCFLVLCFFAMNAQNKYTVESALSEKETKTYLRVDLKDVNDRIDPKITEFIHLDRILLMVENQNELDLTIIGKTNLTSIEISLVNSSSINIVSNGSLEKLTSISVNNAGGTSDVSLPFLSRANNTRSLGLNRLKLKELPESVYQMKGLKYLYLAGNQINSFDDRLAQLMELEDIELGKMRDMEFIGNPIDGDGIVPLFKLPSLDMLHISGCDNLFLEDFILDLKQKGLVITFTKDQCREKATFKKYTNSPYGQASHTRSETGIKGLFTEKLRTYICEPNIND